MFIFRKRKVLFCKDGDGGDGNNGGGGGGGTPTEFKVGDKVYTTEQIQALEGAAAVGQKILTKAQQYDLDPDAFLSHSEGALSIVADLSSKGIVKADGTIVLPEPIEPKDKGTPFFKQSGGEPDAATQALQSIQQTMNKFGERLETMEKGQSKLFEERVRANIKQRYPGLTDDDVSFILTESTARRKPLLEVAEHRAGMMTDREKQIRDDERKKLAEKYGLDYEQLNEQKTLDPTQGAAVFTQGKKLSFKKGKDTVSPREATMAWLKAKGIGG
jgi:hypothetical protein